MEIIKIAINKDISLFGLQSFALGMEVGFLEFKRSKFEFILMFLLDGWYYFNKYHIIYQQYIEEIKYLNNVEKGIENLAGNGIFFKGNAQILRDNDRVYINVKTGAPSGCKENHDTIQLEFSHTLLNIT